MDESDVSVMLLYSVFHRSSSLADANFAAFTGQNSVNNASCLVGSAGSFGHTRCDLSVVSDLRQCRKRQRRTNLRRKVKK